MKALSIIPEGKKGSNRTFMELKSKVSTLNTVALLCSNRTFMELKLEMYCQIPRQPFRPF